jgi:hypothetical protein
MIICLHVLLDGVHILIYLLVIVSGIAQNPKIQLRKIFSALDTCVKFI